MKNTLPCIQHLTKVNSTLNILANLNRLSLITHLQQADMTVNELADAIGLHQAAVSQHLVKMKEAGLVTVRSHRQTRIYSLVNKPDTLFGKMMEIGFLQTQQSNGA